MAPTLGSINLLEQIIKEDNAARCIKPGLVRVRSFHAVYRRITLPESPPVHGPRSSQNSAFLVFYEGFIT